MISSFSIRSVRISNSKRETANKTSHTFFTSYKRFIHHFEGICANEQNEGVKNDKNDVCRYMNLDLHFKASKRHIIILNNILDRIERELKARDKDETRRDHFEPPEELGFYKEYNENKSKWWWRRNFPKHTFLKRLHIIIEDELIIVYCRTGNKPYSEVSILQCRYTPETLFEIILFANNQ